MSLGKRRRSRPNDGPQAPPNPIPHHRIPHGATHGIRNLGWTAIVEPDLTNPHRAMSAWSGARQLGEGRTAADSVNQAESLARPRWARLEHRRPRGCAYGVGNRASSCVSDCWAGRSASRMASSKRENRPQRPERRRSRTRGEGRNGGSLESMTIRSQRGAEVANKNPRADEPWGHWTTWVSGSPLTTGARPGGRTPCTGRAHQSSAWG